MVACEDVAGYANEQESPHELSLNMLLSYATQIPNEIAYDYFKRAIINLCESQDDPLKRKAGLKILSTVSDNDAL